MDGENPEGNAGESATQNVNKHGGHGDGGYGGPPVVFFSERTFFGGRKPSKTEWITMDEMYESIGKVIEPGSIDALQRVQGLWRIYLLTLTDKVTLLTQGASLRGTPIELLHTNPRRLDGEGTTRVRIKNIPLSVDDTVVTHPLILKGLDVISLTRERFRYKGKMTNCKTGDRIVIVNTMSLKEPLPPFMSFGIYTGRIIHNGQPRKNSKEDKCTKCLQSGHKKAECPNEWMCLSCHVSGHKKGDCPVADKHTDTQNVLTDNTADDASRGRQVNSASAREKAESSSQPANQKNATSPVRTEVDKQVRKLRSTGATPSRAGRPADLTDRSPPTPAEELNELTKRGRHRTSRESSDYSDGEGEHSFV